MHAAEQLSLDQIRAFLQASQGIRFEGKTREQIYSWVEKVLVYHQYRQQKRPVRGLVRRYLEDDWDEPGAGDAADSTLLRKTAKCR